MWLGKAPDKVALTSMEALLAGARWGTLGNSTLSSSILLARALRVRAALMP